MAKRKSSPPAKPEQVAEGVRLAETSTGMFKERRVEVDVEQAGPRVVERVLSSMLPAKHPTLAEELAGIEQDVAKFFTTNTPEPLRQHADGVLRIARSLQVSIENGDHDYAAVKAIRLGKAVMALMLRDNYEETVATVKARKAGRGARFQKHDPAVIAKALREYRDMRADGVLCKTIELRIKREYGIPPRTLREYLKAK